MLRMEGGEVVGKDCVVTVKGGKVEMTTRNGREKVVMVPLGSGYGKVALGMPDVGVGVMEQMRDELLKMRVEKATRREPAQQPKCPRDESQQPS